MFCLDKGEQKEIVSIKCVFTFEIPNRRCATFVTRALIFFSTILGSIGRSFIWYANRLNKSNLRAQLAVSLERW